MSIKITPVLSEVMNQQEYDEALAQLYPLIAKYHTVGVLYLLSSLLDYCADSCTYEEKNAMTQYLMQFNKTSAALIGDVADKMRKLSIEDPRNLEDFLEKFPLED